MLLRLNTGTGPWILAVWFLVSRAFYAWAGVRFDGDTYYLGWQFIDPYLLKHDLWRSLFYLHSQPPLLNLFTGLGLQLFPQSYSQVFHGFFLMGGLLLTLAIYFLGQKLGLPDFLCLLLAGWFAVSPATIVYENWYAYAYPLTVALAAAGVFLARYIANPKPIDGVLFSLALAGMALTWGLFHLVWLVGCFALVVFVFRGRPRKWLPLLPALLLVLGWYAKNEILYGSFTASSWGGMNLSKIATLDIPEDTRERWAKEGLVSDLAPLAPFRSPEKYLDYFPDTPITGIPLLDQESYSTGFPNYHSLVHVAASRQTFSDAIRMIRLVPRHYALNVLRATYIFFHSASDYEHVYWIRQPVDGLDTLWNRVFYWQWDKDEGFVVMGSSFAPGHVAWALPIAFVLAFAGSLKYLWDRRTSLTETQPALVLFMLWNILFVSAASLLLDIGENNRFRFVIDPFLLLLCAFVVREIIRSRAPKK